MNHPEKSIASMQQRLDEYAQACRIPDSLPDMQTWDARKDKARFGAVVALEYVFTHEQLRSMAYIMAERFNDELAETE